MRHPFSIGSTKFGDLDMLARVTNMTKSRCRLMLRDLRVPVWHTSDRIIFLLDVFEEAMRLMLALDAPGYAAPGSMPRNKGGTHLRGLLTKMPDIMLTPAKRKAARQSLSAAKRAHKDAAEAVVDSQLNVERLDNITPK